LDTPYENETRVEKKKVNEANTNDRDSNLCNNDSDSDSNSEDEIANNSDDDGYGGYSRYNEYDKCDRGYYYRNRRYERKTSPMMSFIISPVTA
jgi:hypothetical protein